MLLNSKIASPTDSNRTICLWIISFEAPDLNIFVELRPILAALHPELVIDRQRINIFAILYHL